MNVRAVAVIVFALLPSWSCADESDDPPSQTEHCETCNLDEQVSQLAAAGATDCGELEVGGDSTDVLACVTSALDVGNPFIARQQLQGIDSSVIYAYLVDDDGDVVLLSYDSNICGGGQCTAECGPRVSRSVCGNARAGAMPDQAIIDCDLGQFSALCEPPQ
ncbi:MAG: hypothetical protein K0V04_29290 [Deltaproteobacteria bacterium]|nr:hypothetical protein [Deltaproteobacteria bacterium]